MEISLPMLAVTIVALVAILVVPKIAVRLERRGEKRFLDDLARARRSVDDIMNYQRTTKERERAFEAERLALKAAFARDMFVAEIARLTTDAEMDGDMSGDDAVSTLSALIEEAREILDPKP